MDLGLLFFVTASAIFVGWLLGDLARERDTRRIYHQGYQDGYNQCRDDARFDAHG